LFNVGNVLLCIIYQLNFTVFIYVTRISPYIAFGIIRGTFWNVLPADNATGRYCTLPSLCRLRTCAVPENIQLSFRAVFFTQLNCTVRLRVNGVFNLLASEFGI
jgi:hypothetical protein